MISRRALLGAGAGLAAAAGPLAAVPSATAQPRRSSVPWHRLESWLTGDVVLPGQAQYDPARKLATAMFDTIHPQAVVLAESPRDVSRTLRFAQHHGLHTAVRSGGHNYGGWSTSEGLVINMTRMNGVRACGRTAKVGTGAQGVDIVERLAPHGVAVAGGFCPSVSPGGFITGGGTGWQYRKYGPASDQLVSARVVLADGRVVTASRDSHPDLYWALRGGGGGNFGVVTHFEVEANPITHVGHYVLTWDWDDAPDVVHAYLRWAEQASGDLACGALLRLPDAAPGNRPTVIITGVHFGGVAKLERELAELVSLAGTSPATRAVEELSYERAMMRVFGCEDRTVDACHLTGSNPEAALPRQAWVKNRGRMFDANLSRQGVTDLLTAYEAERRAGQTRIVSLLGLGARANLPATGDTAWVHRDALYSATCTVSLASATPPAEERQAAQHWLDGIFTAIDPHSNGRSYVNFPDTALENWAEAYYGSNLPRLRQVKRSYDPHGFFRFPQSVPLP
ncbi:FAD-binding oxidoreductase [Streptomyces chumphonensis]|uniref:FAD-binding oxidoreductase n=1 Tax=Streptomyces chumphonensis TaxID=1214925 RepID=A0A927IDL9_9ACTN|nr:FAD-binding oxidoreductase [Streptomyces chumphonensis]MBD3932789.1 FAD-binding oxidoreductase [Streptomyces chumphonensis]